MNVQKFSPSPVYIAFLSGAAALILFVGFWFKPVTQSAESAVEQERTRLEDMLRRNSLNNTAQSLAEAASRLFPYVVRVEESALSGVAWTQGDHNILITAPLVSSVVSIILASGEASVLESRVANGELPVAVFQLPGGTQLPVPTPAGIQQMRAGQWMLAVWRNPDGSANSAPGFYAGVRALDCGGYSAQELLTSMPLTAPMAGGGIFDLDGKLAAVVAACRGRYVALAAESLSSMLMQATSQERQIEARFGVGMTALGDQAREYFRVKEGLLISQVKSGSLAEQAGLFPGDVLASLNGEAVRQLADLKPILAEDRDTPVNLRVVRRGKTFSAKLSEATAAPPFGVVFPAEKPGVLIETIVPDSAAEKAGIQAGDRLLTVDGVAVRAESTAASALSRMRVPGYVVVQRGDLKLGMFLDAK